VFRFGRSPPWASVTYWSLDVETGGLNVRRDALLSIGMVPIRGAAVRVGEAYATLVRPGPDESIREDSIRTHQLVPSEVVDAPPPEAVIGEVDRRLREGALLVHNASVDVPFLRRLYRNSQRHWPAPPVVDTVNLLWAAQERQLFREPASTALPELELGMARARLGLPPHSAHDALSDALATAELFLVLAARLRARTLADLR